MDLDIDIDMDRNIDLNIDTPEPPKYTCPESKGHSRGCFGDQGK